jgi:threonine dehydrogenase-like Zn-dependent dehydrogenase
VVSDINAVSPGTAGVDKVIDCVGAGSTQTDICNALNSDGPRMYAAVIAGFDVPAPGDVTKLDISGWSLVDMLGGKSVIPALTSLVEEGKYKVPDVL